MCLLLLEYLLHSDPDRVTMTPLVLLEILVWLLNDVKSDYGRSTQFTGAISRELVNPYSFGSVELRLSTNTYLYLRVFKCIGIHDSPLKMY